MKTFYIIIFILLVSCSPEKKSSEKMNNEENEEVVVEVSSNKSVEEKTNKLVLADNWKFLLGKRWYSLLRVTANGPRKYIEPACLSDGGAIEFIGEEVLSELMVICGQDASALNNFSVQASKDTLKIDFDENGEKFSFLINRFNLDTLSHLQAVMVRTNQLNRLFHSYYPDSILELNKDGIVYLTDSNITDGNFFKSRTYQYLQENKLYDKLACPDEQFE